MLLNLGLGLLACLLQVLNIGPLALRNYYSTNFTAQHFSNDLHTTRTEIKLKRLLPSELVQDRSDTEEETEFFKNVTHH
jgi:hypothetical protein